MACEAFEILPCCDICRAPLTQENSPEFITLAFRRREPVTLEVCELCYQTVTSSRFWRKRVISKLLQNKRRLKNKFKLPGKY
jgi:hypothetical protein